MVWSCKMKPDENSILRRGMVLEVEGRRPVVGPKKTWSKVAEEDMRKLNITEDMAEGLKAELAWAGKKVTQIFKSRQRRGSNWGPCDRKAEILLTAPTMPTHFLLWFEFQYC